MSGTGEMLREWSAGWMRAARSGRDAARDSLAARRVFARRRVFRALRPKLQQTQRRQRSASAHILLAALRS